MGATVARSQRQPETFLKTKIGLSESDIQKMEQGHAYRVDGTRMFNSSEWLGTTSAAVLGNAYHPGNERGAASVATRVGFAVAQDRGFDVLREFWPEVSRKFNLPFRGSQDTRMPEGIGNSLDVGKDSDA